MGVLILKETRKQEVGVYVSPWTRVARAAVREKGRVTVYVCVCIKGEKDRVVYVIVYVCVRELGVGSVCGCEGEGKDIGCCVHLSMMLHSAMTNWQHVAVNHIQEFSQILFPDSKSKTTGLCYCSANVQFLKALRERGRSETDIKRKKKSSCT